MIVKLLTEHHLEFLSLKGGCRGSSGSTHVKMPHCWKSHALAHYYLKFKLSRFIRFHGLFLSQLLYTIPLDGDPATLMAITGFLSKIIEPWYEISNNLTN